jgi:hypothetical protein
MSSPNILPPPLDHQRSKAKDLGNLFAKKGEAAWQSNGRKSILITPIHPTVYSLISETGLEGRYAPVPAFSSSLFSTPAPSLNVPQLENFFSDRWSSYSVPIELVVPS